MDVKGAFRRAGQWARDRSLLLSAVVGSTLLSVPFAYLGMVVFAFSAMCYDAGPGAEADACVRSAMAVVVLLLSTLAVPVVVAVWGWLLRRKGETGNRALLSMLWYVVVLVGLLAGFARG